MFKKLVVGMTGVIVLSGLSGCELSSSPSGGSEFEQAIKEDTAAIEYNGAVFLGFVSEGVSYYGDLVIPGSADVPFEQEKTYEEYDLTIDEEARTVTIETEDGSYQMDIVGPRLLRSEQDSIEFTLTDEMISKDEFE